LSWVRRAARASCLWARLAAKFWTWLRHLYRI